jgi:hypothetical protein
VRLDEGEWSNWMRGSGPTGVGGAEQLVHGEKKLSLCHHVFMLSSVMLLSAVHNIGEATG